MRKIVVIALLLLVLAGCGGGRDVDVQINIQPQDDAGAPAVPTRTRLVEPPTATQESAAAPADTTAPTTAPVEPTAAPAEPTASLPQPAAPTEAPTEAPSQPTAPPPPPPTEAPAAPADDQYTFDPSTWEQSMTTLSTFRQKVVLAFTADGSGAQSKATYEGEVTTNPSALHSILRVEGQGATQLPSNQVEAIWIGDQVWVKIGRRPWVQVPASAVESEYAGQVVGIGDLLPFIQQAQRVMPDDTVNGIPCKHYVYDTGNLQTEAGMTSAQGDIWVAKDGGYVVRLTLNGQGTYYGTYSSSGTLNLIYDLYDVNAPIQISPPR